MKRVQVNGYENTISIVDVPSDYWECSVCGVWHPTESFCDPVELNRMQDTIGWEGKRTRTNCQYCYELPFGKLPFDNMKVLKENTKSFKTKNRHLINKMNESIHNENTFNRVSETVCELIERLKKYPPNMRIALKLSDTSDEYGEDFYTEIGIRSDYVGDEEVIIMGDRI